MIRAMFDAEGNLIQASGTFTVREKLDAIPINDLLSDEFDLVDIVEGDFATADGTAIAGVKYSAASGPLAFAAGETKRTITVPLSNDAFVGGTTTFRVTLSNPTGGAILGTSATAKAGEDYQAISGALEFKTNETSKGLTIPILRHAGAGPTRAFNVGLSNPTGGLVLGTASASMRIEENYCTVTPPFVSGLAIRRETGAHTLTWSGGAKLAADRGSP